MRFDIINSATDNADVNNPKKVQRNAHLGSLIFLLVCLCFPMSVQAQNLAEGFSTFSADSNEPIDVKSDKLRIRDEEKTATFTGNVVAVQGEFSLRALELQVLYSGDLQSQSQPQSSSSGSQGQIKSINAKGNIVMKSGRDQTANSDWVIFDVPNNLVTIGGNVVLKQGKNTLRGDTLIIDLKSGKSRFEKGRVRGRFMPVAAKNPR